MIGVMGIINREITIITNLEGAVAVDIEINLECITVGEAETTMEEGVIKEEAEVDAQVMGKVITGTMTDEVNLVVTITTMEEEAIMTGLRMVIDTMREAEVEVVIDMIGTTTVIITLEEVEVDSIGAGGVDEAVDAGKETSESIGLEVPIML